MSELLSTIASPADLHRLDDGDWRRWSVAAAAVAAVGVTDQAV